MRARPSASAVVVRPDTPLTMRGFGRNWVALDGTLIRLDVYIMSALALWVAWVYRVVPPRWAVSAVIEAAHSHTLAQTLTYPSRLCQRLSHVAIRS